MQDIQYYTVINTEYINCYWYAVGLGPWEQKYSLLSYNIITYFI